MRSQPTSSAALVVVNEAKAWGWSCRPNRKEEHVKLDLAACRANIARAPSCRSFRCNDDKANPARERALIRVCNRLVFQQRFLHVVARLRPSNSKRKALGHSVKLPQLSAAVPEYVSHISIGILCAVCLSDNLIAGVAVVLQHAPGCSTDTHNAQLFPLCRRIEI